MIAVAFKLLCHDRAKFLAMIMAIGLAAFLMQNQGSMLRAFLGMSGSQIRDVREADLWVMEPDTECFDQAKPLPEKALQVVRGVEGVQWAVPLLKVDTNARTDESRLRTITLLGVDPSNRIGEPKMRFGDARLLYDRNGAVIDPGGWEILYPGEKFVPGRRIRVHDQWLTIHGISEASPPFTGFPIVHTSIFTARELNRQETRSTTFLVGRAAPGEQADDVAARITDQTQWKAMSREVFELQSYRFYESQGVPMIFNLTIVIGLVVGTAFTAQTFLMFVKDNARSLITMKVMGITHRQLAGMIAVQAGYLTFLGLAFGTFAAAVATTAVRQDPFLRGLYTPVPVVLLCAVFMALIALISAFLAFRRVLGMQPADVFRS
jgi:putative ABC transport system permease protein